MLRQAQHYGFVTIAQNSVALRLGLRQIDGFREDLGRCHHGRRARMAPSADVETPRRARWAERSGFETARPRCRCLALAQSRPATGSVGQCTAARPSLPLFAFADAKELAAEPDARLPAMPLTSMLPPIIRPSGCR